MSLKCKLGIHRWQGCKCSDCAQTRDNNHEWQHCRCRRCGRQPKTLDSMDHNWQGDSCAICGEPLRKEGAHPSDVAMNLLSRLIQTSVTASWKKDGPLMLAEIETFGESGFLALMLVAELLPLYPQYDGRATTALAMALHRIVEHEPQLLPEVRSRMDAAVEVHGGKLPSLLNDLFVQFCRLADGRVMTENPKMDVKRLNDYLPNQIKGLVLFLSGGITTSNADAVNKCINDLVPQPLSGVRLLHEENVDITDNALIIAQLYKSVEQFGISNPTSIADCIIEERFTVSGHGISGRLFGIV